MEILHFFVLLSMIALAASNEATIKIPQEQSSMASDDSLVHRLLLSTIDDPTILKQHEQMARGQYDWKGAHKAKGGKGSGVYIASKDENHVPDLVAIHPDLLFKDAGLTEQRLTLLLQTITQVAAFTKKSVVWPALPCNLPWVLGPQGATNATPGQTVVGADGKTEWIVHIETSLPSSFQGLEETKTTVCSSRRHLTASCLTGSPSGVTSLEFEHIKERYRIWRPYDPSPEKIILAQGKVDTDVRKVLNWSEPIPKVTYHEFVKQVSGMTVLPSVHTLEEHSQYTMHVVYIGQAFEIDCSDVKKEGLPAYQNMFQGHNRGIYLKHLPDKSPSELVQVFADVQKRCITKI